MIHSSLEETTTSFRSLLAWCSGDTNKIDVIDIDTKQSYASFDGAKVTSEGRI